MLSTPSILFTVLLLFAPAAVMADGDFYMGIGAKFGRLDMDVREDTRLKKFEVEIKVADVLKDGPAARAGIREGDGLVSIEVDDRILAVDVTNYIMAVDLIKKSAEGTPIKVVLMRPDQYGFLRKKTIEVGCAPIDVSWGPYVVREEYYGPT